MDLKLKNKIKTELIYSLATCSGHSGMAGGQYLDLNFEHKKVNKLQLIKMQNKKTGKLFSFCCGSSAIIKEKKVHILVTFIPSLELLVNEFKRMSKGLNIDVNGYLVNGALNDLKNDQVDAHNKKIMQVIKKIPENDTVILGQFSMARAADVIAKEMPNRVVLNTPDASVLRLRDYLLST